MLHSPWWLLLLLVLPVLPFAGRLGRRTAAVRYSYIGALVGCGVSLRQRLRWLLMAARLACLALLIVALARPRKGMSVSHVSTEGVAMEIVVDRSGSMGEAMNYQGQEMTRLDVVKRVAAEFIRGNDDDLKGRAGDLLGLVVFSRYADTLCPLVHGHEVVVEFLQQTELARTRSEDGTAIGDALALAAARLKTAEKQVLENNARLKEEDPDEEPDFTIKSKVIVLLTDGVNNAGEHSPLEAAKLAKEWGIKIYTIGIGGEEAYATRGIFRLVTGPELDERLLRAIAEETGGFYGKATDGETLRQIYEKIDRLEKTRVKSVEYTDYAEQFGPWAAAALGLLAFEIVAGCTIFRKIP
jgi:Ca-activated chloride channel family protein